MTSSASSRPDSMLNAVRKLGSALLDLALPPRCHLCRACIPGAGPLHLCPACHDQLPFLSSPCCSVCGRPFDGAGNDHPCGTCLHHPPPWQAARAALIYDDGCRELIHAFKYRHRFHLRRPLALLTAQRLADYAANAQADLLAPVPLHPRRLRQRGFNQSLLLAEVLEREWQLPLQRQLLQRTRYTTSQTELSAEQRVTNLRGAFAVPDPSVVTGKRVLLVDDVFTTGATLTECSSCLLQAGAAAVLCVTVAHAPLPCP